MTQIITQTDFAFSSTYYHLKTVQFLNYFIEKGNVCRWFIKISLALVIRVKTSHLAKLSIVFQFKHLDCAEIHLKNAQNVQRFRVLE